MRAKPSMVLLATVSGLSPFTLSIILPALPALAGRYGTDTAGIQFLVSGYLLGLALSQPLWGPLADRIGRRPTILAGLALFVAASLACLFATGLEALVALRTLQGMGSSAGTVVARAVIRDTHDSDAAGRAMSLIAVGLGSAPIVAPVIGGALLVWGDSGALFWVTAVAGAVLWLLLYRGLPETLSTRVTPPPASRILGDYRHLLSSRGFMGYTSLYGMTQGGFFAFLAVGAEVFRDSFGLGPGVFGIVWGAMGAAYVVGALLGGRLSSGARRPLLLPVTASATLVLALLLVGLDRAAGATLLTVLLPLSLMMILAGVITPLAMAGAVYQEPELAGTAAGLSSALGMTLGGSFTVASGVLYVGDFSPVAALIATAGTLTFLSWLLVRRL